jgi:hypothetical protein
VKPLVLIVAGLLLLTLPQVSSCPAVVPSVAVPSAATAAVYVYEKDETPVPSFVTSALNKLNRERKIVAGLFEADQYDGQGQVPEQYRLALQAARKVGMPAIVSMSGKTVLRAVTAQASEAAVLEAVP